MQKQPFNQNFFGAIAPEFDAHVRQSIPLFDAAIANVVHNVVQNIPNARILDVGGSTGHLGRLLVDAGFAGEYVNVDGSPAMVREGDRINVRNPEYIAHLTNIVGGVGASWVDCATGLTVNQIDLKTLGRFDVVIECLTLQFFTAERYAYIKEFHSIAENVIFIEKFSDNRAGVFEMNERKKDLLHKSHHFSPDQIAAKKNGVLDAMHENLASWWEFERLAYSFADVRTFYTAGNFRGFVSGDLVPVWITEPALVDNHFCV